ncbi:YccF domain-containing protein [Arcanobacterium bovis]|uniref:YccF domain-containing protein n=1 Tax=Arcanobacterium bovis TaxID=2529275 RepID=A0A4V2KR14_9ACTO|nr:YccF domain-containing protein [Arcanobacterium bovis]TBW21388.1 YccF domain-containing protein [Arcanobacterium bovis]
MRFILNVIWLVLSGFWLFWWYVLFGVIACLFIVTIPAGVACFRIAFYVLWPFGRTVVDQPNAGVGSMLMNVVWFIVAGLPLAVGHVVTAVALALTIIGVPLAWANIKLIPVTCFPFGKQIVLSANSAF